MTKVGIVGAGIGGLTLALALARRGLRPHVLEAAPVLGDVGAGITLSPNSTRVLMHLGVWPALEPLAVVPGTQHTMHWRTGETLRTTDRGHDLPARYGAPYAHVHRADLHAALVAALEEAAPNSLRLAAPVADATPDATVTLASGETLAFDALAGADGVRSTIRRALFSPAPPAFAGQVAWRGLVPAHAVPAMPPGIHIGPGHLFMRYPVRGGALINYAAFVATPAWEAEGWTIPSSRAELASHFAGWHAPVLDHIDATPDDALFKWGLHVHEPLPTWIAGRATLLGDAAHAMLPFMGQGAGTAIEDAMLLARALAEHPVPHALAAYEAARRDRTTAVQQASHSIGRSFQGEDPAAIGAIQDEESLGLFAYDATTAPF
jgi:salicylate hydroxylase